MTKTLVGSANVNNSTADTWYDTTIDMPANSAIDERRLLCV